MGAFSPRTGPHHIHRVHRAAAAGIGTFLLLFGVLGFVRSPEFASTSGPVVLGLATNGLLATLSLAMGTVLLAAALRSGPFASTVSVAAGAAFLLSGIVNVLLLSSPMNMLGFGMANVIFSLLVGATLLVLGSYGRFTGSLPADSPYSRAGTQLVSMPCTPSDGVHEHRMADAERAVALHCATAEQTAQVHAASAHRSHAQRLTAFRTAAGSPS